MGRPFQKEITQPDLNNAPQLCPQDMAVPRVARRFPWLGPFSSNPSFHITLRHPGWAQHWPVADTMNTTPSLLQNLLLSPSPTPTRFLLESCSARLGSSICCFVTVYIFVSHIYRCTVWKWKQITYGFPGFSCTTASFSSCHRTYFTVEGTWIN